MWTEHLPAAIQLLTLALIAGLYRKLRMNQLEKDAIARLENEIGNMSKTHEAQKAQIATLEHDKAALVASNADLAAQLTAVQGGPAEVANALNALSDKVDAEFAPDAPASPPAVDPNAAPAS